MKSNRGDRQERARRKRMPISGRESLPMIRSPKQTNQGYRRKGDHDERRRHFTKHHGNAEDYQVQRKRRRRDRGDRDAA